MERLKLLLLIGIMLLASGIQAQENEVTQQAAQAYDTGDYIRAITLYEQALMAQQNGSLYYNLGVAYYAEGDLGNALLNFRRAALYIPRDMETQQAITQIREERNDSFSGEANGIYLVSDTLSRFMTVYELAIVGLVLWSAGFAVLTLGLLRRKMKRFARISAVGLGIILTLMLTAMGMMSFVQTQQPGGVVIAEEVQVMNGPGMDFLPLYMLHDAAEFRMIEQQGEWLRFVLTDGRQGWIETNKIKLIPNNLG
ncbi:MAG: hypothetical protein KC496_08105 [Anaerolineae bacterium]|nr:hypothetical protein [Anaerolineae bacterium]